MLCGPEYLDSRQKAGFDRVTGLILAAVLLPAGAAAGIASAVDNRSISPLFRQMRSGPDNTLLEILKFRTIRRELTETGYESFGVFDQRASFIGQTLRRYGIDEYPQLIQVLSGRLHIGGIRPLPPQEKDKMRTAEPQLFEIWDRLAYNLGHYGLISSSSIYRHNHGGGQNVNETIGPSMIMDVEYCQREASLKTDLQLVGQTPISLLRVALMSASERLHDLRVTSRSKPSQDKIL